MLAVNQMTRYQMQHGCFSLFIVLCAHYPTDLQVIPVSPSSLSLCVLALEISRFRVRVHFRVSVRVGSEFTGIRVFSVLFSSIESTIWVYIHYGELIPLSGLETLNIRLGKPYEHMTLDLVPENLVFFRRNWVEIGASGPTGPFIV